MNDEIFDESIVRITSLFISNDYTTNHRQTTRIHIFVFIDVLATNYLLFDSHVISIAQFTPSQSSFHYFDIILPFTYRLGFGISNVR